MPQDDRFDWLVDHFKPKSEGPEGKGLGNAFLSHIAAVDGIFHLCRGFPGEKVRLRTGPRQLHTFGQAVPQ